MKLIAPHIVQYQGSKRFLAPQILRYVPRLCSRFIEPFAGSAAMTIATALENRASSYWINDLNAPLVGLLQKTVEAPLALLEAYSHIWNDQFTYRDGHVAHFYAMRERFNNGEKSPELMLYLLARCVKGSVRYGSNGNFNQSPDKRRHGTTPNKLANNLLAVSSLLKNRCSFSAKDYRDVFASARSGDILYMDPPYQGVSNKRDNRYFSGVPYAEFVEALYNLNTKGIDYIISYDGTCGDRGYGEELPKDLNCRKFLLCAGLSTQSTFLGRREMTYEALYVSKGLCDVAVDAVHFRQNEFPDAASW